MSTKSSSSSSSTFVGNDSSQFDVITPIKPPLIGFITPLSNVYNNAAAASKSCQKQQSNVEQTVMCGNSDSSEINIDQLTKSFTSILIVDKEMYNCKHKDQEFGSCVICLSPFKSPSNFKTTKCKVSNN